MRPRVIPVLLLQDRFLVKTTGFRKATYVGDPINTVKILNEKGADEVVLLDIGASRASAPVDFRVLENVASEAFMPLAYGGGIRSIGDVDRILRLGVEKVVLNTALFDVPNLVEDSAMAHGVQAVVASIDVGRPRFARKDQVLRDGARNAGADSVVDWARELERRGAGEILLTDVRREGLRQGFNLGLVAEVSRAVTIPVVAHGGAGSLLHFREAVDAGASAVAAGTYFTYQGERRAVLINYPSDLELTSTFQEK